MKLKSINRLFGLSVKNMREARNMSQSDLSRIVGMTQAGIAKIETGKVNTSLVTAITLSKILGISIDRIPIKFELKEREF
jgi:DNA-binding XRE family transcriptional regulator